MVVMVVDARLEERRERGLKLDFNKTNCIHRGGNCNIILNVMGG